MDSAPYTVKLDDTPPAPGWLVGGKGRSLMRLSEAGLRVPGGVVFTTRFFAPWLDQLRPRFAALGEDDVSATCAALQEEARGLRLTDHQRRHLEPALDPAALYAVRSSSPEEDLASASFAGEYETLLGVRLDGMGGALARVFASCLAERVVRYKRERGLDPTSPNIAVVVQEMVAAEVAGVAMSIDPTTNDHDEIVVDASPGLGEPVVSGQVTPDHYVISKVDRSVIDRTLGRRELCLFLEPDGSVREVCDREPEWALTDEQLVELAELLTRIEALYGCPVDVEWAVEDGALVLLQARPVATWIPLHPTFMTEPGEPRQLWVDFSLIEQGMPRPLTMFGSSVYDWFMKMVDMGFMGVDLETYDNSKAVKLARAGRIYTNVGKMADSIGWARTCGIVGALDSTSGDILRSQDPDAFPAWSRSATPVRLLLRAPGFLLRTVRALLAPRSTDARIRADHASVIERIRAGRAYPTLRQEIIHQVGGMAGDMSLLVVLLLGRFAVARLEAMFEGDERVEALTRALPGNITVQLGIDMADLARALPEGDWTPQSLVAAVDSGALPSRWIDAWNTFMTVHGCRGPREVDAGQPRYRERPELVAEQLLAIRELPPGADARARDDVAQAARGPAHDALRAGLPAWKRWWFDYWYGLAVAYGGFRETPKYTMVVVVDHLRTLGYELADALVAAGRLDHRDDLLYLTTDHLFAAEAAEAVDLRGPVVEGRAVMARMHAVPEFPRVVDSRGRIYRPPPRAVQAADLVGTPLSAGVVRGRVRVLDEPDMGALGVGEILVARATDPGWTPLFPVAGGLLLEVGGTLQHGALVAREYGKPCIVGIPHVTEALADGTLVEMDGAAGTVVILTGPPDAAEAGRPGALLDSPSGPSTAVESR